MGNRKRRYKNRIIVLVIMICVFSLISMFIACFITIKKMADYSARTNTALGDGAAESASEALTEQAHELLMIIAQEQARNCNSMLNTIKYNVELIEGVVMDMFNNPEYYSLKRPVLRASEVVEGVFSSAYTLPKTVAMTNSIQRELDLLSNLSLLTPTLVKNPSIVDIYVGMESGLFYDYTPKIYDTSNYDPRTRPWYIQAVNNPNDVIFTEIYEDALGLGMVITAAKAVKNKQGRLLGVAAFDILLENLEKLILETRILESGFAFIINNEGKYIIHPKMGTEGFAPNVPDTEGYRRMMSGETGFFIAEEMGEPYFTAFGPIDVASWSVGVIVYEDDILSLLKTLSARMSALSEKSEKDISRMSRLAVISFSFISIIVAAMIIFLSVTITKNTVESELQQDRIAIMLSQIQPHFLYNSLVVIRQLCRIDPKIAEETVVEFSNYLRGNLDSLTLNEPVPFEKELKHVETYLAIEKKRFGDKLNIYYNIKVKDFTLPALTLQPIVENAVKYGITKKENGGTVIITAEKTEKEVLLIVTDDGAGFDQNEKKQDDRMHIGIENVRSRLEAMCGGSLLIESRLGEGTRVVIKIPREK